MVMSATAMVVPDLVVARNVSWCRSAVRLSQIARSADVSLHGAPISESGIGAEGRPSTCQVTWYESSGSDGTATRNTWVPLRIAPWRGLTSMWFTGDPDRQSVVEGK